MRYLVEIKISVSEKLDEMIQKGANNLVIKKAELVKMLVLGNFKKGLKDRN